MVAFVTFIYSFICYILGVLGFSTFNAFHCTFIFTLISHAAILFLLSMFSLSRPWRDGRYQLRQCLSVFNHTALPLFLPNMLPNVILSCRLQLSIVFCSSALLVFLGVDYIYAFMAGII